MDDREKNYIRKIYEYVLQQNQSQQYYTAINSNSTAYGNFKSNAGNNMNQTGYDKQYNHTHYSNNNNSNYQKPKQPTYQQQAFTPIIQPQL